MYAKLERRENKYLIHPEHVETKAHLQSKIKWLLIN